MNMKRYLPIRILSAVFVGGLAFAALGQSPAPAPASLKHGDRTFVVDALQDGMAEVETGQLAQQHGSNDLVKQFGAKMVQDHGKAGDELRKIGEVKGVKLPTEPTTMQKHEAHKLAKLDGAAFDKEYTAEMVKGHEKAVKSFTKMSTSAKDPDVRDFAARTLPTLKEHLQLAREARRAVNGK
jgi:putative membrane protein